MARSNLATIAEARTMKTAGTTNKTTVTAEPGQRTIVITRIFDAPRDLVWQATTRPEHLRYWWGLKGSTMPVCEVDLRVGGSWRFVVRNADGEEDPFKGEYREITPPSRLVQTFIYDMPAFRDMVATETATYDEIDGGTRTKLSVVVEHQSVENRDGHVQSGMEWGMNQSHARLDELLATLKQIASKPAPKVGEEVVLTRTFNAPRELVFKAWTDPKMLARWWGPHYFDAPRCEIDARPGGAIHIDMRGPDGNSHPMKGIVHEVVAPERLVFTSMAFFEPDGTPMIEARNTVLFAEQGGKTTITLRAKIVRAAPAILPALAGMELGWSQSLEKLADLVAQAK